MAFHIPKHVTRSHLHRRHAVLDALHRAIQRLSRFFQSLGLDGLMGETEHDDYGGHVEEGHPQQHPDTHADRELLAEVFDKRVQISR